MAKKLPFLENLVNKYLWTTHRGINLEDPNQTINGITAAQLFGGKDTKSGQTINENRALTFSAVWACTRAISDPISFLPPYVYRRKLTTGEVQVDRNHSINNILKRPNKYSTWNQFINRLITHRTLWGNGLAKIEMDSTGRISALHLIHPSCLKEVKKGKDKLEYIFTEKQGGEDTAYSHEDIIHLPGFGDDIIGKGVVSYAREDLGLELAVQEYGSQFFDQGGKPSGILSFTGQIDKNQGIQIKESFNKQLEGGGVAALGGDMNYTPITVPPDDMQFLATRTFNVTTVARWFGVPPWMIGDLSNGATFNNIEHTGLDFLQRTITPIVSALEAELNYKLFSTAEQKKYSIEIDMRSYVRADSKTQSEQFRSGIQNGYQTINEVRQMLGLSTIEGGDQSFIQSNLLPLDQFSEMMASKIGVNQNTQNEPE